MCLLCVEFEKQRLSLNEAIRNFGEMRAGLDPEHAKEVESMLREAEREAKAAKQKPTP